jgi:secreted trypsin-like serine protease
LVQLEKPVTFGPYVQPACLYTNVLTYPQDYLVAGWGEVNRHGSRKERLQKGYVRFESLERCAENLPRDETQPPLRNTQLCAVHKKTDTCQGDSGGPLQKRFTATTDLAVIVGITSYGSPTCGSNNPTVYTSVSMYLNWIEGIVWPQDSFL